MKFGPSDAFEAHCPHKLSNVTHEELLSKSSSAGFEALKSHKELKSNSLMLVIRKFVAKLKSRMLKTSLPNLKLKSLRFDELNAYIDNESQKNWQRELLNRMEQMLKNLMISPDNFLRLSWNCLMILALCFCLIYFPFKYAFNQVSDWDNCMNDVLLLMFFLDFFFNFITGEFIDGLLVMIPSVIRKNYLKKLFIWDFLGFISLFFQPGLSYNIKITDIFRLLILAKIPRLFVCAKSILILIKFNFKYNNLIEILKLLCFSLYLAHIMACLWFLCSQTDQQRNWVMGYGIQNEDVFSKYVYSLYWTIATIMTVGYGDITPKNPNEALFSIFTIVFGCGLYAFNLNSIGLILQNNKQKKKDHKNDLRIIKSFMERNEIDLKLQRRVQEYLNFVWMEQKSNNVNEEKEIINKLNDTLKEELLLESYGQIFLNSDIFLKNFSEKSLRKIVKNLREIKLIPGEVIYEEETLDDCSIYVVNSGSAELFLRRNDQTEKNSLHVFQKGDIFGEDSFFKGNPREFSCQSLEFTSVLKLSRNQAIQIFQESCKDYEMFCWIKDKMLFENCESLFKKHCLECHSLAHSIKGCPLLHYVPDYERIIKRNEYYNEQPRKIFARAKKRRFSASKIHSQAKIFQNFEKILIRSFTEIYSLAKRDTLTENFPINEEETFTESDSNVENQEIEKRLNPMKDSNENHDLTKNDSCVFRGKKENDPLENDLQGKLTRCKSLIKDKDFKEIEELDDFVSENYYISNNDLSCNLQNSLIPPTQFARMRSDIGMVTLVSTGIGGSEKKETFPNRMSQTKQPSEIKKDHRIMITIDSDKMKSFKNYYPEMNFEEIKKKYDELFYFNKELEIAQKNRPSIASFTEGLFIRLRNLNKYTIYSGKIKGVFMKEFMQKMGISLKYELKEEKTCTIFSPLLPKTDYISSFFERNKLKKLKTKSLRSLLSTILTSPNFRNQKKLNSKTTSRKIKELKQTSTLKNLLMSFVKK